CAGGYLYGLDSW
nr:immunoglobulin heavy chain junction region [Macaca mulatta]